MNWFIYGATCTTIKLGSERYACTCKKTRNKQAIKLTLMLVKKSRLLLTNHYVKLKVCYWSRFFINQTQKREQWETDWLLIFNAKSITTSHVRWNSSVQSLDRSGHQGDMWDGSAEIFQFFCRRPLWAVLALTGMSTLRCCPSNISFAIQGVAHPPRCPKGQVWRGCHGMWHAWTRQV